MYNTVTKILIESMGFLVVCLDKNQENILSFIYVIKLIENVNIKYIIILNSTYKTMKLFVTFYCYLKKTFKTTLVTK